MVDKKIIQSLDTIMGDRFSKYSKYIIQDRALPDVRDGLKPVQRRILYSMYKEGNLYAKAYRKSAKTVGNVIGNYHPHGDSSVYDAMVRMSQDWKYRAPLIDMQGNNGSIDNDPAAAMRYTEARLSAISEQLLRDLDKDTVLHALNFDDTEYEPTVLPAAYPNLLVNGATGISAGYATDIPPHNLHEVIDATIHRIKHPSCTLEKLMEFIKGPDFPTGAIVEGKEGIINAFKNGKGKVIVRCRYELEETKQFNKVTISEIPYEVNKADLVRKIDEIRFNKSIDGIIEVRDESDRNGLTIVIELKKEVSVTNTMNYLYKNTDLQKNYNYNIVAIKDKRPVLMGVKDILDGYIEHQVEVITRSTLFDFNKAKTRQHIVDGLIKAISILDDVVTLIRSSKDKADAKQNLIVKYEFSEKQAEAIVMLQLYRLTNTDIFSLQEEKEQLDEKMAYLQGILNSDDTLRTVIIDRLKEVKSTFKMPRLSTIRDEVQEIVIDEKAMVISEDVHVSITRDGYIKRISKRSAKSSEGTEIGKKDDDYLVKLLDTNTQNHLLVFTNLGNYLYIPVFKIEEFKWKDLGKHISYLVKLDSTEKIIQVIEVEDFNTNLYVMLASSQGMIKRTELKEFEVSRFSKPLRCMKLKTDDEVISVQLTNNSFGLLLATRAGYSGIYSEVEVSVVGIKAAGIKAINLKNDQLVSVSAFNPLLSQSIMIISDEGAVKRLKVDDITFCNRTNKGMLLYKTLKSRAIYLKGAFVCKLNDEINIYFNKECYTITPKDFQNASIEQKPTLVNGISKDTKLDYIYTPDVLSTKFISESKLNDTNISEIKEDKVKSDTLFDFDDV